MAEETRNVSEPLFETILVTGCAGDIGQGIGRLIRQEGWARRIVGCDIHEDHAGTLIFDKCGLLPRATEQHYLEELSAFVHDHAVSLLVPTSEAEIGRLYEAGFTSQIGTVPLLMANAKAIEVGLDKLATTEFLKNNALAFPWTQKVCETDPYELPCIQKPQRGQGSKGFCIVDSSAHVALLQNRSENGIWQELLEPRNQEYTCGVFASAPDAIRSIAICRKLQGGMTGSGVVVDNSEIDSYLKAIAIAIHLKGSINVQLVLTERGPVAFEINPRFSSTVVFRHLLGFKDFLWSLQLAMGRQPGGYTKAQAGVRIYRGVREYLIGAGNKQ